MYVSIQNPFLVLVTSFKLDIKILFLILFFMLLFRLLSKQTNKRSCGRVFKRTNKQTNKQNKQVPIKCYLLKDNVRADLTLQYSLVHLPVLPEIQFCQNTDRCRIYKFRESINRFISVDLVNKVKENN